MDLLTGSIVLLIVTALCDAVEKRKNLTSIVGGSITLPDPVVKRGFLLFDRKNIAMVSDRKLEIYEDSYTDKVLYDSSTERFTITGLQRSNSGIYSIDSKGERPFLASYELTVYESVPVPAVKTQDVFAESCTLQCSVEKGEDTVTLLWYKDEQILNQSSSALSLPLTVLKQEFNSSYRCVAANPAENKSEPVNIVMSCGEQNKLENLERHYVGPIVIPIVLAVIVIIVAVIIKWKYSDKSEKTTRRTQDSVNTEPDLEYSELHISEARRMQGEQLGPADNSTLTSVYVKLDALRLA